jgi:hypothetical protein
MLYLIVMLAMFITVNAIQSGTIASSTVVVILSMLQIRKVVKSKGAIITIPPLLLLFLSLLPITAIAALHALPPVVITNISASIILSMYLRGYAPLELHLISTTLQSNIIQSDLQLTTCFF